MSIRSNDVVKTLSSLGYKNKVIVSSPNKPDIYLYVHPKADNVFKLVRYKRWWFCEGPIEGKTGFMPYKAVKVYEKRWPIHKLKMFTFKYDELKKMGFLGEIAYEDLIKNKIIVNHKDGDKLNNDIENLEWTTYTGNVIHAFETGLRTDNKNVVCYDIVEDREFETHSMNELGRQIDIHPDYINRYVKSDRTTPLAHRYMVRLKSEERYPHNLGLEDLWFSKIAGIKPAILTDLETGKSVIYPTLVEAAKQTNIKWLSKGSLNPLTAEGKIIADGRFRINFVTNYYEIIKIKNDWKQKHKEHLVDFREDSKPRPIKITKPDGTVMVYPGLVEAAKAIGKSKVALKKNLYVHNHRYVFKGYVIEYV